MPLVYYSLESDNPVVLEKALRVVPKLCETLDYTTVKQTLFPKITTVFSKTTLLSVKVNTLICFHAMINVLDKFTLTEKLVPLLARIKTKEPSVMIATLAVHEEMGKKCEVEASESLWRTIEAIRRDIADVLGVMLQLRRSSCHSCGPCRSVRC